MKLKEVITVLAPNQLIVVSKQLNSYTDEVMYRGRVRDIPEDLKQYNTWLILPGDNKMELQILIEKEV